MKGRTLKEDRKGFTLVELIVVIAILAILAAVAYPVYTGYITKANEAADQVLLGAVNEAFRSALYDVGYSAGELPAEANASLMQKKVTDVQVLDPTGINIKDAFFKYFEGNGEKEFKVVEGLLYNQAQGFYASLNGGNKILFGGGNSLVNKGTGADGYTEWEWNKNGNTYTIKTQGQDILDFNASSFGQNMSMDSLMSEMSNVIKAASYSNVSQLEKQLGQEYLDYLEDHGIDKDSPDYTKALASAVVLKAADMAESWTTDSIFNMIKTGKADGVQIDNITEAALAYGLLTGFANSETGRKSTMIDPMTRETVNVKEYYNSLSAMLADVSDPNNSAIGYELVITMMAGMRENTDFMNYMDSHGKEDISGYIAAMNSIRNNKDSLAESGTLGNGFADDDLAELLSALFAG